MASRAELAVLIRFQEENQKILKDVSKDIQDLNRHTGALSATAAGMTLQQNVTEPLVNAGRAAVDLSLGFEASLNKMEALVGLGHDQVVAFAHDITEISIMTGVSERELADAMFFITSAGLRGAEAVDALTASAMAADAGLGSTVIVADAVTSAMNAYGAENLSAAQATAVLVGAVREGKMPAEDLAGAVGKILPIASEMGIEFHELGAAIAAMTRLGLDANEATTSLRGIMAGLLKPTEDSKKAMREMGLSVDEVRRVIREDGLLAGLTMLKDNLGDNEDAMVRIFPNVRALTGVLNLVGESAEETQKIFANMAEVTEEDLLTAFNLAQTTGVDQMEDAMNALNITLRKIGDVIVPILIPVIGNLTTALLAGAEGWSKLSPGMQQAALAFLAVVAAAGPVVLAIGAITGLVAALASPLGLVVLAIGALAAAFIADFGGIRTMAMPIVEAIGSIIETVFAGDIPGALTKCLEGLANIIVAGPILLTKILAWINEEGPPLAI